MHRLLGVHPVAVTAATVNNFLVIDITALVQAWLNGAKRTMAWPWR